MVFLTKKSGFELTVLYCHVPPIIMEVEDDLIAKESWRDSFSSIFQFQDCWRKSKLH